MRFTDQAAKALQGKATVQERGGKKGSKTTRSTTTEATSAAALEDSLSNPLAEAVGDDFDVEVSTTVPDGAEVQGGDSSESRPGWMEKDKIFDDNTPFFGN